MQGESAKDESDDDAFASRWGDGSGAEIMGANTFGPPGWQDDPEWRAMTVRLSVDLRHAAR